MAFNPNIPQASDKLSQSQADILGNFQALGAIVNQGILDVVDLPVQAVAPTPATPGDILLYNFLNPTTTKNEGYVHKYTQAGSSEIPFTASVMSNTVTSSCDNGWSYLPSGLLLKWGRSAVSTSSATINFQTISGGPTYTRAFRVLITPDDSGSAVNFTAGIRTAATTTTFVVYANNPSGTTGIRYLVLGV
jgi:hypothetical protein